MPSPKSSSAEFSNRMNQRLETVPLAAVAMFKRDTQLPCGLLDLVARRMIHEVPGKPSEPLGRD